MNVLKWVNVEAVTLLCLFYCNFSISSDFITKINYSNKDQSCPEGSSLIFDEDKNLDAPNINIAGFPLKDGQKPKSFCIKYFNSKNIEKNKQTLISTICKVDQKLHIQIIKQRQSILLQAVCLKGENKKIQIDFDYSESISFMQDFTKPDRYYPLFINTIEYVNGIMWKGTQTIAEEYKIVEQHQKDFDYSITCPSDHKIGATVEDGKEIRFCIDNKTEKRNGPALITFKNDKEGKGTFVEKGSYSNGNKSGTWNAFYPSGKKLAEFQYEVINGKSIMNGTLTSYHENGNKVKSGNIKDGLKEGLWNYWYENGNLWKTGLMVKDNPIGEWICFDETHKFKGEALCKIQWASAW